MENYRRSIEYIGKPEVAFHSITKEMSDWWTKMSGRFETIGDKAKTDFGGESYWVFEAKTLKPQLIELRCCEANHIHGDGSLDMRNEWYDSVLKFELIPKGDSTEVQFTHIGLTPDLKCFDVCERGWDHYFLGSLKDYLSGLQANPSSY